MRPGAGQRARTGPHRVPVRHRAVLL